MLAPTQGAINGAMRVKVTLLRSRGRRLKRSELAAPAVGRLVIDDWPTPNAFNRWVLKAQVVDGVYSSIEANQVQAMFDPQIKRVDETGMYIQGTELHSSEDGVEEHIQVWLCQPHL